MLSDEVVAKCKIIIAEVVEHEKELAGLKDEAKELTERIRSRIAEVRRLITEGDGAQLDAFSDRTNPDANPGCELCQGKGQVWQGPDDNQELVECPCVQELADARARLDDAAEEHRAEQAEAEAAPA